MRITRGRIQRRRPADRRPFQDDESAALKMSHDALRRNRGRHAVGVVDALPAREQEREGDRFRLCRWRRRVSFWSSGMARTIPGCAGQSKNAVEA
jgi:hypothetical protein